MVWANAGDPVRCPAIKINPANPNNRATGKTIVKTLMTIWLPAKEQSGSTR